MLLHFHKVQVILSEIDCTVFYTDLHELFCQFISWTNWVKSGKISCQAVTDMENFHDNLIIINLYFIHFNNEMIHRIDDSFVKKKK